MRPWSEVLACGATTPPGPPPPPPPPPPDLLGTADAGVTADAGGGTARYRSATAGAGAGAAGAVSSIQSTDYVVLAEPGVAPSPEMFVRIASLVMDERVPLRRAFALPLTEVRRCRLISG